MSGISRSPVLLVLLLAVPPVSGQANAALMANDHYTRSHDYDLVHERIELRDFDWDEKGFQGRATLTLRALRPDFDSVVVDAGKLLEITRVNDRRDDVLFYSRRGDTLVVYLAKSAAFGDTVVFSIAYRGKVVNGRGLTFIEAAEHPSPRPRQIWSQGEAQDNHLWFPTYDFPNDKTTWELSATVPAGFTLVSNGRLIQDLKYRDGTRTMAYRLDKPASTYLVSIVVAPLLKLSDRRGAAQLEYFVYPADTAMARQLFRVTPDMMAVFTHLTRVEYPWSRYAQTTVADFFGGMENVTAATLVDWVPNRQAYLDRPWYQYELIPHELAHQWFGDYVTLANWANMWLNEGFATFMPGQYWAVKLGPHAAEDYYLEKYGQFQAIDRRRRMPLAALNSNNVYPKGALVLRMLQQYLGEERFWAAVHRYLADHALGVVVTDDLRQSVLQATGENLDWFWDQWIYQAGYPEFDVSAAYDSTAARLSLQVRQIQVDSAQADSTGLRYSTPLVFRMPVTIRVGTRKGDVSERVRLDSREQTIVVDGVRSEPTMVVFDDGNTILKSLTFAQPTPWLAAQLRRDANLWNRAWVIGQLAQRPGDPDAGSALRAAVTGSDYYLTRAQAAGALAAFPPEMALPSLEPAVKDTSAQVRAAAIEALGTIGEDRVWQLASALFETDPSYEVRAAALGAMAGAPDSLRRPLVAAGLRSPSYRDVIQDAALGVVAQTVDTSFVPTLGTMVIERDTPALVLAVLAGQGSGEALEVLIQHLNDPRPVVRQWVVEAFEQGMRPELAVRSLTAAEGGLRYEDTRAAVAATIERLQSHLDLRKPT